MNAYLELGYKHITDVNGYDHILFLVVLCAIYPLKEWKKILLLVTAFTVGHSITLAIAAMKWIVLPSNTIEILVPITIFLTAIYNIINKGALPKNIYTAYGLTAFFGLIHGFAFSNFFAALLGKEESIVQPLFLFNVGVELGQLIIVAIILAISFVLVDLLKLPRKWWNIGVSVIGAGLSIYLLINLLNA